MPKDKESGYSSSWGLILSVIFHGIIMVLLVFWGVKQYSEPENPRAIDVDLTEMRFESPGAGGPAEKPGLKQGGDGDKSRAVAKKQQESASEPEPEKKQEESARKKPLFRQEVKVPEKKESEDQKKVAKKEQEEKKPEPEKKKEPQKKTEPEKKKREPEKDIKTAKKDDSASRKPEPEKKPEKEKIPLETTAEKPQKQEKNKKEKTVEKTPEPEPKAVKKKDQKSKPAEDPPKSVKEEPEEPDISRKVAGKQEESAQPESKESQDVSDKRDTVAARKNVINDIKRKNIIGSLKRNSESQESGEEVSGDVSAELNRSGSEGGGSGGPSSRINPTVLRLFQQSISERIKQKFKIPPSIPKDGSLNTEISFKIDKTGNVSSVKVEKSSGNVSFDKYCVNAVYSSSPFPSPPAEIANLAQSEGFLIDMNNEG